MWWMGRLRRDRRMIGLFPSNFVTVLDDDFHPAPHRSSPMTPVSGNTSRSNSQSIGPATPSPSKALFRSPFRSYALASSPNPEAAARDLQTRESTTSSPAGSISSKRKMRPYSSMNKPKNMTPPTQASRSRPPSPTIPAPIPRASSPLPQQKPHHNSRAPSPSPFHVISRQPSPAPRAYLDEDQGSGPPPPTHRIAYTRETTPESGENPYNRWGFETRTPSPAPSDPHSGGGFTPSPLRNAMNDVLTSLEDMGISQHQDTHRDDQPVNPWSPEAFDEMYARQPQPPRPHTSHAVGHMNGYEKVGDPFEAQRTSPQLQSYVKRMEKHLALTTNDDATHGYCSSGGNEEYPPKVPLKGNDHWLQDPNFRPSRPNSSQGGIARPSSSNGVGNGGRERSNMQHGLRSRKSAYELGRERLQRTFTTRSSVTTASSTAQSTSTSHSSSTQKTSQSLMSGYSAGGFSATSAGSLARRTFGLRGSIRSQRPKSAMGLESSNEAVSGVSYHSSHDSNQEHAFFETNRTTQEPMSLLGGFSTPAVKKRGFLGKVIDSVKTGAANARSNISTTTTSSRPPSRQKAFRTEGISSTSVASPTKSVAQDMGLGGTGDWVQMRRDVNRSNSLSRNERNERIERCQMSDVAVLTPVETLNECLEGDEGADGRPVPFPTDILSCNFSMVDKSARFLSNLPALINAASLAQGYLCRPYKSDVQRLRAIFTWIAERIVWEEDFEGDINTRRVIQTKRGCSEEIAVLVAEMCSAIGVHAEVVRGHLKIPGDLSLTEDLLDAAARPNHWWNAVIADGEWRILDCSLANPSNPRRSFYSSAGNQVAEGWWFLCRPSEVCYTHVPLLPEQQHIVPPVTHDILMALPIASPPYFKNNIQMWDYNTSLVNLEGLEMACIQLSVPDDVECIATVSARAYAKDADGDFFESGEIATRRALAQGDFVSYKSIEGAEAAFKRYTIKAYVPSSSTGSSFDNRTFSNTATLNIYTGRRGLMHSVSNNPHPLTLSLPLVHIGGPNPNYEFFTRHPTPHALRHELYVTGPLCKRLVFNNTFVFGVRQHPASANWHSVENRPSSPRPGSAMGITRPGSAMSITSVSISGSAYSNSSSTGSDHSNSGIGSHSVQPKPAKLAIQSPSGKILRMTRKSDLRGGSISKGVDEDGIIRVGSNWESIIKIGERGTWRGLVLADRSARWCVFGEWECV